MIEFCQIWLNNGLLVADKHIAIDGMCHAAATPMGYVLSFLGATSLIMIMLVRYQLAKDKNYVFRYFRYITYSSRQSVPLTRDMC